MGETIRRNFGNCIVPTRSVFGGGWISRLWLLFLFLFRQKFHSVNLLPLIQFCARGKGNWLDFWSVVGGSNWEGFPTTGWASFRSLLGGKKLYRKQWVPSISASASGRSTLLNGNSFHFKFTTTGARHPAGRVLTAPEGSTVGLMWEVIWIELVN